MSAGNGTIVNKVWVRSAQGGLPNDWDKRKVIITGWVNERAEEIAVARISGVSMEVLARQIHPGIEERELMIATYLNPRYQEAFREVSLMKIGEAASQGVEMLKEMAEKSDNEEVRNKCCAVVVKHQQFLLREKMFYERNRMMEKREKERAEKVVEGGAGRRME